MCNLILDLGVSKMNKLQELFSDDIFNLIVSKLYDKKCVFENCYKEASMLGRYCRRHWCEDGHPTTQRKYRGYCEGCFTRIMNTDKKKICSASNYEPKI